MALRTKHCARRWGQDSSCRGAGRGRSRAGPRGLRMGSAAPVSPHLPGTRRGGSSTFWTLGRRGSASGTWPPGIVTMSEEMRISSGSTAFLKCGPSGVNIRGWRGDGGGGAGRRIPPVGCICGASLQCVLSGVE
uniref:Uncharacterized protein n=1 Tax=Myotis myotis TaxID=51298 RepID=A0A7J7R0J4_MYOMY|nr:hypothetical protein mMyoMyo1_011225 [Myotis myotis]